MILFILYTLTILILLTIIFFYTFQEKIIFNSEKLASNYKFSFSFPFKEFYIKTKKEKINLIKVYQENPKGIILFFSGNSFNMNYWVNNYVPIFYPTNFDILFFDYPGFGKSKGKVYSEKQLTKITQKIFEDIFRTSKKKYEEIIIYGVSFGTGLASKITTLYQKNYPIKKLFLETPYYSFLKVAKYHYPYLPASWLLKYHLKTYVYLSEIQSEIYIFHGTDDRTIPYNHSKKLIKLNSKAKLYTIKNGAHRELLNNKTYLKVLQEKLIL